MGLYFFFGVDFMDEKVQLLANVVESSDDAIITKSLEGFITTWNKGAELIYGYSAEEIIGKNISILAPTEDVSMLANLNCSVIASRAKSVAAQSFISVFEQLKLRSLRNYRYPNVVL